MEKNLYLCFPLMLGTASLMLATVAHAARIDGLSPLQPVSVENVVPAVTDNTMHIGSPDTHALLISPWPKSLPQRFGKQTVTGTRQLHPAGPIDRIAFSRNAEPSPWLYIGNGARRSSTLFDEWQLQLTRRGWAITDGYTKKVLGKEALDAKPAMVSMGADRWCIYLLDSTVPDGQANLAKEAEPQIGWAAVRLHQLQKKCSVAKTQSQ
jgi:hypothetical protein